MGWWDVDGTNTTIGDEPLDALGDAIAAVIDAYQREWNRRPTVAEWETLLRASLGGTEPNERVLDRRVVTQVKLETT